jgi:hypothetical protein
MIDVRALGIDIANEMSHICCKNADSGVPSCCVLPRNPYYDGDECLRRATCPAWRGEHAPTVRTKAGALTVLMLIVAAALRWAATGWGPSGFRSAADGLNPKNH